MLYEIDRFNLGGKPSLEEIQHKEYFQEMAREQGWQEITHDESLTYYFAKEYIPGDINELYNDEESRRYRAEKFREYLHDKARQLTFWTIVMAVLDLLLLIEITITGAEGFGWFNWLALVYVILFNIVALYSWKIGDRMSEELILSREEWDKRDDPSRYKTVGRLILTARGLSRFLRKKEQEGLILTGLTTLSYTFENKEEPGDIVYTMDSQWLTNKRLKARKLELLKDKKDWIGINNDWQIQSVRDAKERGWQFVCALENRAIVYKGQADRVESLNDPHYDNSLRGISLIGKYGAVLLISGLLGGIIGGFMGVLL